MACVADWMPASDMESKLRDDRVRLETAELHDGHGDHCEETQQTSAEATESSLSRDAPCPSLLVVEPIVVKSVLLTALHASPAEAEHRKYRGWMCNRLWRPRARSRVHMLCSGHVTHQMRERWRRCRGLCLGLSLSSGPRPGDVVCECAPVLLCALLVSIHGT